MIDDSVLHTWEEKIKAMENSWSAIHFLGEIAQFYEEKDGILTTIAIHEYLIEKEILWLWYHGTTSRIIDIATPIVLYNISEEFESIYDLISQEIETWKDSWDSVFPWVGYQYFSILGRISKYWWDNEDADMFFGIAEKFSDIPHWPFRYHKKVGIVSENDTFLDIMKWSFEIKKHHSIDTSWHTIRDLIEKKAREDNWSNEWELSREIERQRQEDRKRIKALWQPIVDSLKKEFWIKIDEINQLEQIFKKHPEITPYLLSLLKDWEKYQFNVPTILWVLIDMDVKKYGYQALVDLFTESTILNDLFLRDAVSTLLINIIRRNRTILTPIFSEFITNKKYGSKRGIIINALRWSRDQKIIDLIVSVAYDEELFFMFSFSQWRPFWKKHKPELLEIWGTQEMKKKRKILEKQYQEKRDLDLKKRDLDLKRSSF